MALASSPWRPDGSYQPRKTRSDHLGSSVPGGLFAAAEEHYKEVQEYEASTPQASQRPTGGGGGDDFLARLSLAEARDVNKVASYVSPRPPPGGSSVMGKLFGENNPSSIDKRNRSQKQQLQMQQAKMAEMQELATARKIAAQRAAEAASQQQQQQQQQQQALLQQQAAAQAFAREQHEAALVKLQISKRFQHGPCASMPTASE